MQPGKEKFARGTFEKNKQNLDDRPSAAGCSYLTYQTLLANGAPAPTPRTDKITAKTVYWKGNVKRPVHLIDTPGMIMEDSGADRHGQPTRNLRAQMEECLRKAGHVNVFLLVIDGSRPLLGDQLDVVLRAYKDMFGRRFLQKKGVLAVTNWPRADSFRITEEQMRNELNTFLKYKRFIDFSIPVVFIDAISPLDEEMTKLWNMLLEIPIPSMIS